MNNEQNNMTGNVIGSVNASQNVNPTPVNGVNQTPVTPSTNTNGIVGGQVIMPTPPVVDNPVVNPEPAPVTPNVNANGNVGSEVVMPTSPVVDNPVVSPEPTPAVNQAEAPQAYTNPQNINPVNDPNNQQKTQPQAPKEPVQPAPMPTFTSSTQIGTTPPISLEPDKKPQKKNSKILFIILILVAIAGVGYGTYYVLKSTNILGNKNKVTILLNPLQLNVGETLPENLDAYANVTGTAISNCTKDVAGVNTSVPGTYEYSVNCGGTIKKGSITILDSTELAVNLKNVYKVKGEKLEANEFASETNNKLSYEFVDKEAVDKILAGDIGTFTIKIKVKDSTSNKETEAEAKLYLLEFAVTGILTCSQEGTQNLASGGGTMAVSDIFYIVNDTVNNTNNVYGNLGFETYTFVFSDETEYNGYKETYNTSGTVSINEISGDTIFDDAKKSITIIKQLDNNTVINDYGKAATAIKSYFQSQKGYKCNYERKAS